ncbi:MAG: cytochrome c [Saprospiraceae bacterium]|nr:cytochrome c [Saprospiraceae bacterium]
MILRKSIYILVMCLNILACNESPYMQGKRLYTANCQNCHMEDGSGLAKLIPPLATSQKIGSATFACILKNGIRDTIRQDSSYLVREMPAFSHLSATEVANIINFVNHSWHTPFKEQTILDVENVLNSCK